jgi:hypothetical protein|tara:strand:- start:631 stop:816 length:186 start_codon:yes stop_codon:yes gene_type:complete
MVDKAKIFVSQLNELYILIFILFYCIEENRLSKLKGMKEEAYFKRDNLKSYRYYGCYYHDY